MAGEWLNFNNRDFSLDSRKEFKKRLMEIQKKEIERPEALDIEEFATLHKGIALQNLNQFCHVSFTQDDRTFTSQAWNMLFRIQEQFVREYVMEFLSSFTFRDNIVDLDSVDTMVFQLGGEKRSMTMRYMDGGVSVDVPWHVAKFFADKAKGYKKKILIVGAHLIGPETSLLNVAKLLDLGICKYNVLGHGEMFDDVPEVAKDKGAGGGMGQADVGGVRRHPNMTTTNKLRAMDERLGDIETDIPRLVGDINELTYVVSGMSEQYDQFYGEFGHWRTEQERFLTWNTYHLSQLLAHHHIDHTRYNGTPYAYVSDIPDLVVQQGVNFMYSTPIYSTAPSSSPNPFGLFGDANAGPSTSQNQQDDMNED
ncbi:hypothetical protein Tco_0070696 [Tanacetum coccineum]